MTNDFDSINDSDVILVIGSNTTEAHPVIGSFIRERVRSGDDKAALIVCDPRKIELADDATIYLQQKIGTDVALINCMMNIIIKEELHNEEFIEKHTENFDELRKSVEKYTPQKVERITGVPRERIIDAAWIYANGRNSAIFYTMGITQHTTGTNNVKALSNLALLCGMFGRSGVGINPLRGQNNVQGACDAGCLPTDVPGYQKVSKQETKDKIKSLLGFELPATEGKSIVKMTKAAGENKLKGLFIMGENPMVSDPDTNHTRHAFSNLDLLVVQDIFLTETAQIADVVLPAACWGEKDGTFTNSCRTVQRVRKAVTPPGEAKPDWLIIKELAEFFGVKWSFDSPSDVFDEIAAINPAYGGITYKRIEEKGLAWPCPTPDHPGTPILHVGKFARSNGKAQFLPTEWFPPHEEIDSEYPFIANTGRILYHYHTGSMTRRSVIVEFINRLQIEMNPIDAKNLAINQGDRICVASRRGKLEGEALITERTPKGSIFVPFHFGEAPAHNLTSSEIDPLSETPPFKISAVKIEKV
jgi:formate dehydrogenase alpha subunit